MIGVRHRVILNRKARKDRQDIESSFLILNSNIHPVPVAVIASPGNSDSVMGPVHILAVFAFFAVQ
jgi:hypothetical protein